MDLLKSFFAVQHTFLKQAEALVIFIEPKVGRTVARENKIVFQTNDEVDTYNKLFNDVLPPLSVSSS